MDDDIFSIHGRLIAEIVKEQDEYTMKVLEDYVKKQQASGEIITLNILPEGKIRHIFNLGVSVLNQIERTGITPKDLFRQEEYITYLRREIHNKDQYITRLENQIKMMEEVEE